MIQHHPQKNMFNAFCQAFGQQDDVAREIEKFWAAGGSPLPQAVYAHLVRKLKEKGDLSDSQEAFLTRYFNESFAPERTTGYADKHREPLLADFAEAYAKGGARPMFRIEADIMNLSGFNRAITGDKGVKSHLADGIIRVMAGILKEELERCGTTSAIRHGGDELCLYVNAKDKATVDQALNRAHQAIAILMDEAKLSNIVHEKSGKMPGVGIGAAAITLKGQNKLVQYKALQAGVKAAKEAFQSEYLGPANQHAEANAQPPALADHIRQLLGEKYKRYLAPSHEEAKSPLITRPLSNTDPEIDRFNKLEHFFGQEQPEALLKLLEGTHTLTANRDPVTGLLLFKHMRREILPHFIAKQKGAAKKAKLVHVDFNNVGGGNELGYWVGNAMRDSFAQCICGALQEMGLGSFAPYLAAQDGGKFALLLPAELSPQHINELSTAIEIQLVKRADNRIYLRAEEMEESLKLMESDERYADRRAAIPAAGHLTINDVMSVKSPHFHGSHVMVAAKDFDASKPYIPLGKLMRELESEVAQKHNTKDEIIKRSSTYPYTINNTMVNSRSSWLSKTMERANKSGGQTQTIL